MATVFWIHSTFGERVLPFLIILMAIFLTVTYKPGIESPRFARLFPVLVDLQVGLGIIYWSFLLWNTSGASQERLFSFPFILHPILGILAAGVGHMSISPGGPLAKLGRWGPLVTLLLLLVLVLSTVIVALQN
ncbi:hypothetical protein [Candidatus Chloroploca sp. Khr17]|uniref:hypothetical protein n=1 Tax=Candidatus Chloroploca sp. Khr17 TaxID=2496869 RepID=UPI00101D53A2|nr:hypothetical protein [Candidatus Chloroploca sp. Khr17]